MTDIRDEWVEKAWKAHRSPALFTDQRTSALRTDECPVKGMGKWLEPVERWQVRAALIAVADDIRAQAWDEGRDAGVTDEQQAHRRAMPTPNPYHARAEEVSND